MKALTVNGARTVLSYCVGRALTCALLLVFFGGCGGDSPETPYGDVDRLTAYRAAIDPLVDEINEVERSLRAMAVGSTGRATGENLSRACLALDVRLAAVLVQLEALVPPPRLRDTHADMQAAVQLRRRACERIVMGWQIEQEQSFAAAEATYAEAEAMLAEASLRLLAVDQVLSDVDVALAAAGARSPTA